MFKTGLLISFISILAISAFASGLPTDVRKVHPKIQFVEGADLAAFVEAYAKSNHIQRDEYVEEAQGLVDFGVKGPDAYKMLVSFDAHVLNLRKLGRSGLGVSLEATFKAELDELYRFYNPPIKRIQFVSVPSTADMFFYGTYSVRPYNSAGLVLTITVVDMISKEETSFEAQGADIASARIIAKKVFDHFQKTKFPTKRKLLGRNVELLFQGIIELVDGRTASMLDLHRSANGACEGYDARLVREDEMKVLIGLGAYRGGVSITKVGEPSYFWALHGDDVLISYSGSVSKNTNMNPASYLNYICVKQF